MDGTSAANIKRDPEGVKQNILDVATLEFADLGFDGARVDAIAEKTNTTKRMIYYYFKSKGDLYAAVLDRAYNGIRSLESKLELEHLSPEAALRKVIEFTFDYHDEHPNFVRLIMNENMLRGAHLGALPNLQKSNSPAIEVLSRVLTRGYKAGSFVRKVSPVKLHFMISALCFCRVSNRYTFGANFGFDLTASRSRSGMREMFVATIISYLQ
jgi:AcrR family transcriptional regulator